MGDADDLLEDDPPEPPRPDPARGIRHLAVAVLLRAVLDAKAEYKYHREDARRFLYPSSDHWRLHLLLTAECAGLDQDWLRECLDRTASAPMPELRKCTKCKSTIPVEDFGRDYRGRTERYCPPCRAATPVHASRRGKVHDRTRRGTVT